MPAAPVSASCNSRGLRGCLSSLQGGPRQVCCPDAVCDAAASVSISATQPTLDASASVIPQTQPRAQVGLGTRAAIQQHGEVDDVNVITRISSRYRKMESAWPTPGKQVREAVARGGVLGLLLLHRLGGGG